MNRDDLNALARVLNGLDAATHRIFSQSELEESDHEFLLDHLDKLDKNVLRSWLRCKPLYPIPVARALVEQAKKTGFVFELLGFGGDAARMPDEALDEIAKGTRTLLPDGQWWYIVQHLRKTCSTFAASVREQSHWRIADRLFEHRYDEEACRRELPQIVRETDVETRMSITRWIEEHGLLEVLSPSDVLPEEVAFPFERGFQEVRETDGYFLMLAKRWRKHPQAWQWLVNQSFAAVKRGVPWSTVWRVLPRDVQNDVALRSLEMDQYAPWTILTLVEAAERGEPGILERLIVPHLEKLEAIVLDQGAGNYLSKIKFPDAVVRHWGIEPDEHREIPKGKHWTIFFPGSLTTWILQDAPWPDTPEFEEFIWAFGKRYIAPIRGAILNRLSKSALTRERANRLLKWALETRELFDPSVALLPDALCRLADVADPVLFDILPPLDTFFWRDRIVEGLGVYRKLGGDAALDRLDTWIREPLERGDILTAIYRMRLGPGIAVDELETHVANFITTASFRELRMLHEDAPELVSEEQLVTAAHRCADDLRDRWSNGNPPSFSAAYASAIRTRLRVIRDEQEWEGLMLWLVEHQETPRGILEQALLRLEHAPGSYRAKNQLRALFVNRKRWTDYGPWVLGCLLEKRGPDAVVGFIEEAAQAEKWSAGANLHGMQEALAMVLVKRAEHGITENDERIAVAALSGLVALHPRSGVSGKVRALRKRGALSSSVEELVALNERLLRHDSTHEANWLDARAALSLYRDALGTT